MSTDSLEYLQKQVVAYRDERDWKQFHTPKNCAANIAVEAGELLGSYRWTEAAANRDALIDEVGDIFYTLLLYCQAEEINLGEAVIKKLAKNARKYPVDRFKGSPKKYNES
jgi:dCTP diphosphatase